MDRISPSVVPNFVPLNYIDFWVQVHGLPFGFIQPKVGQGIGSFLGTLKAYDGRNSIHSSYMRIKVTIDVTVPLKKEWRVRASNGSFVTVNFKYEKLGVFCHRCGLLGHTDKVCPELFELDADDGVRNWSAYLKQDTQRFGTVATNRWLQDPILATVPRQTNVVGGNAAGTMPTPSFHDRMDDVQSQITVIKHDVLAAQHAAKTKHDACISSSCPVLFLPSSSIGNLASNLLPSRPLVLGLPAAPIANDTGTDTQEEPGSELKKRKRMLALQNGATSPFAADGGEGNFVIGTNVSHGGGMLK